MEHGSGTARLVLVWLAGVLAGTVATYVASAGASPGTDEPPAATTTTTAAEPSPDGEGEEPGGSGESGGGPKHLALNSSPEDHDELAALGYDVFDVGPDASQIEALPEGGQAMLWVGEFSCDEGFGIGFEEFTGLVDELGDNPGVYGWYLVDEPDPEACPAVVDGIRERADYIHEHAPGQIAFVAATDYEMGPLHPESSHVDLLGLDPYPCTTGEGSGCDLAVMDRYVDQALDAGIPREVIVPVIQVFGQDCAQEMTSQRLPTEAELQQILDRWDTLVPDPELEVSYSWGRQEAWACPALSDADGTNDLPDLQSVMHQRNTRPARSTDPAAPDRTTPPTCLPREAGATA